MPNLQKFFASFFQKRRPCFSLDMASIRGSNATMRRAGHRRRPGRRHGRGPAGQRRARYVVLLEKESHPRFHIGESLLPRNMEIIDRLGVRDAGRGHGRLSSQGAEFVSDDHRAQTSQVLIFRSLSLAVTDDVAYQVVRVGVRCHAVRRARSGAVRGAHMSAQARDRHSCRPTRPAERCDRDRSRRMRVTGETRHLRAALRAGCIGPRHVSGATRLKTKRSPARKTTRPPCSRIFAAWSKGAPATARAISRVHLDR